MTGESKTTSAVAKPSWYVSFPVVGRKFNRTTETFRTEKEAKVYALKLLADGIAPSAGTLNPHAPKRSIAPADVPTWAASSQ
jgi:hypothetical protein